MNKMEYRIAGVRRSGIHPIAMWILEQSRGHVVLLNDVYPRQDPWQNPANILVPDSAEPLRKDEPKDCLLLIFEDRPLERISQSSVRQFVGPSQHVFTVLVLRDPFNLLASRLRWAQRPGVAAELTDPLAGRNLWLQYAREFVGHTALLPSAVHVNYNRWVSEPEYRQRIGRRLGLPQPHRPMQSVPYFGGGSSFEGTRYDGQAANMQLFDRWRAFADDPQFLRLINHAELLNLHARLFDVQPFAELYRAVGAIT